MYVKCDFCDQMIDETLSACPNCGGVNNHMKRQANGVPTTIEELKKYCEDRHMPLEKMRFFIGENCYQAKAFGIYKDVRTGNFIVYKNKSDGTRAVRYEGPDEQYAVNEIYQKIQSEIANQANAGKIRKRSAASSGNPSPVPNLNNQYRRQPSNRRGSAMKRWLIKLAILFLVTNVAIPLLTLGLAFISNQSDSSKYYNYNNTYYYHTNNSWYEYDGDYWYKCTPDYDFLDNYEDYQSTKYEFSSEYGNSETFGYVDRSYDDDDDDWDTDWDDDYDWGDWDSNITDWDSDW